MVVNYLPVGSEMATKWYVEQILDAGCGLGQLHPGLHRPRKLLAGALRGARSAGDRRRHQVAGGRDHRAPGAHPSLRASAACGWSAPPSSTSAATPTSSTCWSATRLESKKISKTNAVTCQLDYDMAAEEHPHRSVGLRRVARRPQVGLHPHGRHARSATCRSTSSSSWKSGTRPNSAGVVIDAVRCAKLALDSGISGALY